ncbi:hypothetical protein [Mesorhizobium cantuariense]|uniref:Pentapeptide repeat-containing protein n=1 Tax=Mesorhizobium cantuariense TaxID=1300275 RepID=A0ABV7MH67_9HYPH
MSASCCSRPVVNYDEDGIAAAFDRYPEQTVPPVDLFGKAGRQQLASLRVSDMDRLKIDRDWRSSATAAGRNRANCAHFTPFVTVQRLSASAFSKCAAAGWMNFDVVFGGPINLEQQGDGLSWRQEYWTNTNCGLIN